MRQKRVVVIEDDEAINEGVVMILEKSGYAVHPFLTVEAFKSSAIAEADIFLIDRQLRGTDGLDFCRQLKSGAATTHIPVLIMSASPNARQYTQAAGGDGFLEKPFSKKQLLAAIEGLIK